MAEPTIPKIKESLPKKRMNKYALNQATQDALRDMELHPGIYSIESIKKWIALGIQKPDWITQPEWEKAENDLTPLQGLICHFAALAMSPSDIASNLGISTAYVGITVNTLNGRQEIKRIQDQFFTQDPQLKRTINALMPLCIQVIAKIMLDIKTKPQTRLEAASKLLDRGLGKPVQQIEVQDSLLRSVFEKLDAESRNVIEVTRSVVPDIALTGPTTESKVKTDPIDDWVRENL